MVWSGLVWLVGLGVHLLHQGERKLSSGIFPELNFSLGLVWPVWLVGLGVPLLHQGETN